MPDFFVDFLLLGDSIKGQIFLDMFKKLDRKKIKFRPLAERKNKMTVSDVKTLNSSGPRLADTNIEFLAQAIVKAYKKNKKVILAMGAHPLRRGNSRIIINLMERGIISHVATNGAVPIHDLELALIGATMEDVERYIKDGKFGNWEEASVFINKAALYGSRHGLGLGESIGRAIHKGFASKFPYKDVSIFAAAYRLGIPITVHKGIGYDITDQHPSADFGAIGKTSGDDFLIFADSISKLQGGVFISMGAQAMGPEVYLKALSMARNISIQKKKKINSFTTGVFDLIDLGNWRSEKDVVNYKILKRLKDPRYYFRPLKTILVRTIRDGGKSYYVRGDFSDTIPVLYRRITELLKE